MRQMHRPNDHHVQTNSMEVAQVDAFLAIQKHKSFTGAAVELHLSQSAVSRRLALLEAQLGAPLLDRLPTGVVLTDAGRAVLPFAEAMIAANLDAVTAVGEVTGGRKGTVSLAIVGTLTSTQLRDSLRGFRNARPEAEIKLHTARSVVVSDLVRRGEAMLGLRYEADPSLDSKILYDEPLVPICAADHPLARRRRIPAATLAGERWLTFPPSENVHEPYDNALREQLTPRGLSRAETMFIDSLTAQKRLVEAGYGLAFVPASSIEEELRAGTLRVLNLARPVPTIPVALIRRPGAAESAAARALADALHQQADSGRRASAGTPGGRGPGSVGRADLDDRPERISRSAISSGARVRPVCVT